MFYNSLLQKNHLKPLSTIYSTQPHDIHKHQRFQWFHLECNKQASSTTATNWFQFYWFEHAKCLIKICCPSNTAHLSGQILSFLPSILIILAFQNKRVHGFSRRASSQLFAIENCKIAMHFGRESIRGLGGIRIVSQLGTQFALFKIALMEIFEFSLWIDARKFLKLFGEKQKAVLFVFLKHGLICTCHKKLCNTFSKNFQNMQSIFKKPAKFQFFAGNCWLFQLRMVLQSFLFVWKCRGVHEEPKDAQWRSVFGRQTVVFC